VKNRSWSFLTSFFASSRRAETDHAPTPLPEFNFCPSCALTVKDKFPKTRENKGSNLYCRQLIPPAAHRLFKLAVFPLFVPQTLYCHIYCLNSLESLNLSIIKIRPLILSELVNNKDSTPYSLLYHVFRFADYV
jgi:hypothetical protein